MSEPRDELISVHRQLAAHEERFNRLVTKEDMALAIAAALDRQTMALEKLEVDMKKRADEHSEILSRARAASAEPGSDVVIRWVSVGLTALIVLLGILQGGGAADASFALDVANFNP